MKYLAIGFISCTWSSKAIWIPLDAIGEDKVITAVRQAAREAGSEIEGTQKGRILYLPIEWETGPDGQRTHGEETQKHLRRELQGDERNAIASLQHLAESSYDLFDRDTGESVYPWSEGAQCHSGGPPNPDPMIETYNSAQEIEEYIIVTGVPLGLAVEYSIRFFLSPKEAPRADFLTFMSEKLGLYNIQLASKDGDYGFALTTEKELHLALNKRVLKVPKVGKILFDYVTDAVEEE
jgi:hypothetical protein